MRGLSVPAALMVPPGVNGYDAALDQPQKPTLTRPSKLLADAGYAQRPGAAAALPQQPLRQRRADLTGGGFDVGQVGVKIALISHAFQVHARPSSAGESSFYILGWGVSTYDALTRCKPCPTRTKGPMATSTSAGCRMRAPG